MSNDRKKGATRESVFAFAKERFGTEPEYLWASAPDAAVLRNRANAKWYGIVMSVDRKKLGLKGEGKVDILDVKFQPQAGGFLFSQKGVLPAYHLNRRTWIGVLLDGKTDEKLVFGMIEDSADIIAAGGKIKNARTETKSILVPANPRYFDIVGAFEKSDAIIWKQTGDVIAGDTIYMYVAAPYSAIMYKCVAVETNIPYEYSDKNVSMKKVMKLRLLKKYPEGKFGTDKLHEHGITSVRGPRFVPYGLRYDLEHCL